MIKIKTVTSAILALSLLSCGNDAEKSQPNQVSAEETKVTPKTNSVNYTKKNSFIAIEFDEGPLKGAHKFLVDGKDVMSTIGAGLDKNGYTNINGGTIFNSNKDRLSSFNRLIAGELSQGGNAPYEKDCGGMIFHDRDESKPGYRKIYVNFTACTDTEISNLSAWEESSPYRKRNITGSFEDTVTLEVNTDTGETNTYTSNVTVSFGLKQKELVK